jgi:hypothetical protein
MALSLLIVMCLPMFALPQASAHTPPLTGLSTFAYVSASPSPIGVNQTALIVFWVSPVPPDAAGLAGDRWRNMTITITDPDNIKQVLGPFNSDPTGSTYTSYTPQKVGTYSIVLNYPGQVYSLYGPTGLPGTSSSIWINDTFLGSTANCTLVVQEQPLARLSQGQPPTAYWTYPINANNQNWSTLGSNWLGGPTIGGNANSWQANGIAPNSAHIMWTKPCGFGGVVGGNAISGLTLVPNAIADADYYTGGSYEGRFSGSMIINGYLYYEDMLGSSGTGGGFTCLDLATGKTVWKSTTLGVLNGTTPTSYNAAANTYTWPNGTVSAFPPGLTFVTPYPTFAQTFDYESQNQAGIVGAFLWVTSTITINGVANTTWSAYDAMTGTWLFNETNIPINTLQTATYRQSSYQAIGPNGEILIYVFNYNNVTNSGWLACWNNTANQVGLSLDNTGVTTNAYQWRPNGKDVDMSSPFAYSWNVSITAKLMQTPLVALFPGTYQWPTVVRIIPGDIILGTSSFFGQIGSPGAGQHGTPDPWIMWAISDKPATRGQLLWYQTYHAPADNSSWTIPAGAPVDPVNRVWLIQDTETFTWQGYSLDTGNLVWGPVTDAQRAFSYYGSGLGGGQVGFPAYGNLYVQGFGGEIVCYDTKTGNVLWKYGTGGEGNSTNSGIETAWGNYPTFIAAIADGKVYVFNNEHSPNTPLYKGEEVRCLDAFTGKELWTLLSWSGQSGGPGTSTAIEAGGYYCYYNYYDSQIYTLAKGPTSAIVNAPVTAGGSMTITGTVMDVSAGTKQTEQAYDFPNGVPAVSDASESQWMSYVYMQQPMPTNTTGVTVTLTAVDPNNNTITIGTATTDTSGTFGLSWPLPSVSGPYHIFATFSGSNSYWGSTASTYAYVGAAAQPTAAPTATPTSAADLYFVPSIVGIIVVVIIGFVVLALLMLRKRP